MSDLACASCGGTFSSGASFCGGCGTQVAAAPPPAPVEEVLPEQQHATRVRQIPDEMLNREYMPVQPGQAAEPVAPVVPTAPAAPAPAAPPAAPADPVVVRRPSAAGRFLPREVVPVADDGVVVSRNVLGSRAATKPQTGRERKIAGGLPDWEPLPPGELLVRRPVP